MCDQSLVERYIDTARATDHVLGLCHLSGYRFAPGIKDPDTGNIRLNTHLATKRPECLNYVVAHEMVHLVVRQHNARFVQLMDKCLANWRVVRQTLNDSPLAHADW